MPYILISLLLLLLPFKLHAELSTCYGTTAAGKLDNGVLLPAEGNNFITYSRIARLAGRTYVHSAVNEIMLAAYETLETDQPAKVYKYAETGYENGGQFKPHKTHQNGLSVDFITPVIDADGNSVHLPTNPLNKFGYNIEFDKNGNYEDYTIDYESLAAHIVALHKAAKHLGYNIWRVIFDPALQPELFKTEQAAYLKKHIQFSKKPSWVRHDEHYHIDFRLPCEPLN